MACISAIVRCSHAEADGQGARDRPAGRGAHLRAASARILAPTTRRRRAWPTCARRSSCLPAAGVDRVHRLPLQQGACRLTADQFIERHPGARPARAAPDHRRRFPLRQGARSGDFAMLQQAGRAARLCRRGHAHPRPISAERVSSSAVRAALAEGDMPDACRTCWAAPTASRTRHATATRSAAPSASPPPTSSRQAPRLPLMRYLHRQRRRPRATAVARRGQHRRAPHHQRRWA
jgi:hypothetical protein